MMEYGICLIKLGLLSKEERYSSWYHLIENLYRVGGSLKRLRRAQSQLWQGSTVEAIAEFVGVTSNNTSDSFATGTGSEHSAKKSLGFSPKIQKKGTFCVKLKKNTNLKKCLMNIIESILQQMSGISQSPKKFRVILFSTILLAYLWQS